MYTLTILPDARTVCERFASGCPCTQCVGFVRYTQTTSGGVRSGRERFASAWLCSVNARVDASGRERRTVSPCLLTDLLISTDTIHMTRIGDICHELSTCNWVTTVAKQTQCVHAKWTRTVRVGSVVCSVNANPTLSRPDAYGSLESGTEPDPV